MEVPVLPSQHADYASDGTAVSARHHRLPLQESTGNVQSHASSNASNASDYCSPVNVSAATTSTTLPLVSCTPASATPTPSVLTPPIVPTQSLQSQHQHSYHNNQQSHLSQQPLYLSGNLVKPLPSQPYQHQQHQYQQQQQSYQDQHELVRRQPTHHHGSLALTGPLAGNGFYGSSVFAPDMGQVLMAPAHQTPNTNVNPIYLSPQFQAYRKKQAEKDDKSEQIWSDVLEDAFLDALLLIPQMGRKKYAMRGQLHGRNMLISEYLWVAYCLSLPPGVKPDRKMARGRKQVSSHIQVLKNFFIHHRCYHFFFPSKEKKEEMTRAGSNRDSMEKESFKDNAVLRALFEGRLPDERPNYEYFGQLLASDALVAIRPNLCWILVSSAAVHFETEGPRRGEAFKMLGNGNTYQQQPLDSRLYPHLHLNHKREEWPERGKIIRGTLLQEYTRALSQKEASSVREISQDWEDRFQGPLMNTLDEVVRDDLRDILHFHVTLDVQEPDRFPEGSELNSLVEVSIEQPHLQNHRWKSVTRLVRPWELMPAGTQTINEEDAEQLPVSEITRSIGNQYLHRPGCLGVVGNGGPCDCFRNARMRRQQQLAVPFPAPEWASMLSMLAGYRKHPLDGEEGVAYTSGRGGSQRTGSRKRSSYGSTTTSTTATGGEDGGDDSFVSTSSGGGSIGGPAGPPTQMDLVRNIAMLQELWSCGPEDDNLSSPPGNGLDGTSSPPSTSTSGTWKRQAVILWTFETIYSVNEKKMEVVKTPAGTGWRFLTTIDPTSQYHQQQALVTPAVKAAQQQHQQQLQRQQRHQQRQAQHMPQMQQYHTQMMTASPAYPTHRDNIMSPHPGYQQHLDAAMSEHLSATWDPSMAAATLAGGYVSTPGAAGSYRPQHQQQHQHASVSPQAAQPYRGVAGSLTATTPPAAASTLPSSYGAATASFEDHQHQPQQHQHHPHAGYANQMGFLPSTSTSSSLASSTSPGAENQHRGHQNHHLRHRQQQPQPQPQQQHQPLAHSQSQQSSATGVAIDPFLVAAGSSQHSSAAGSGAGGAGELPDWDASDMTSALDGWSGAGAGPSATGAAVASSSTDNGAAPAPRGQKRGRSDSLDGSSGGGGFPVATMRKLSHNGFSNWR